MKPGSATTKAATLPSEYDDFPPTIRSETTRQYDPRLYGLMVGTLWPITTDAARRGEHRVEHADWEASLADLTI